MRDAIRTRAQELAQSAGIEIEQIAYFYFIDATLGLCYLRVPTGAPF